MLCNVVAVVCDKVTNRVGAEIDLQQHCTQLILIGEPWQSYSVSSSV